MLIPALIFVFSIAATIKFAIFSWRARMLRYVSNATVDVETSAVLASRDFTDVSVYQELCPSLDGTSTPRLGAVRVYYKALQILGSADWAKSEMALCANYATAVMAQRMARNQVLAAEMRSF